MHDPYDVLGVSPDASADELKRAWRSLAREWHPDRNPAPEAAARFQAIAKAWELLSDPDKRADLARSKGRAGRGELPEDFLLDVADAAERAEAWIFGTVLPHYIGYARGAGVELAARLWADLDELSTPHHLPPARWARRRIRRWLGRIELTLIMDATRHPTVILRHRDFWEIGVTPTALWRAGVTQSTVLDDLVLRAVLMRVAQIAAQGRFVPQTRITDADIAEARRRDDVVVRQKRTAVLGWGLLGMLVAGMLAAAANGG